MNTMTKRTSTSVLLAAALTLAATAFADLQMHGRVSFDGGGVVVRGQADADWGRAGVNTLLMPGDTVWVDNGGATEIELAGGTFLRLADDSKVELASLPPAAELRGWVGSFYIQRSSRSTGTVLFTTPACVVEVAPDTSARVDITNGGGATVTVRWGSAAVRAADGGGQVTVAGGMRVWADPGMLPSDPAAFDRAQADSFDQWNNDRAQVLAGGVKTTPREVVIAEPVIGASDLGSYGEWVYVDRRPYWRPTVVVDYVPYRYGCWNYMPAVGHVWVGEYPFCYVTSHYGRWTHNVSYGWIWSYDPVWSPAWATTVCVGDTFVWAPMDYYYRPVLVSSSAVFSLGGVNFSVGCASYMPATYVTTGWAVVNPMTPVIMRNVCAAPVTQINIWNINCGSGGGHGGGRPRPPVPTPYDGSVFNTRDYNPQRSIRGVPQDLYKGGVPAERAQALEARLGRSQFAAAGKVRPERSPVENARTGAAMRSVRMDRASALQPDKVADIRRLGVRETAPAGNTPQARPAEGRNQRAATPPAVSGRGMERPVKTENPSAPAEARPGRGEIRGGAAASAPGKMEAPGGRITRTQPRDAAATRGTTAGRTAPAGRPVKTETLSTPSAGAGTPMRGGRTLRTQPENRTTNRATSAAPAAPAAPTQNRMALRDMEPGAPAPGFDRPSATPQKTPPRGTTPRVEGGSGLGSGFAPSAPPTRVNSGVSTGSGSRTQIRTAPQKQETPRFEAPRPQPAAPRTEIRSTPRVEAPRVQAPRPQAPSSVRQQPRIEAPRPQPAPRSRMSAPSFQPSAPKVSAPQRGSSPSAPGRSMGGAPSAPPRPSVSVSGETRMRGGVRSQNGR